LRNSALVFFKVWANYLFSKYRLWALIFKIPASAKSAVKYRSGWWNTGHLATLIKARNVIRHFAFSHLATSILLIHCCRPGIHSRLVSFRYCDGATRWLGFRTTLQCYVTKLSLHIWM